jgi:hypothetical protein
MTETCVHVKSKDNECTLSIIHPFPTNVLAIRNKFGQYRLFREDIISYKHEKRGEFVFKVVKYACNQTTSFNYKVTLKPLNIQSNENILLALGLKNYLGMDSAPNTENVVRIGSKLTNYSVCKKSPFNSFREILNQPLSDSIGESTSVNSSRNISLVWQSKILFL